ncbi:hypothetical protein UN64_02300 [Fictibacillus arsenicus]|uniref:Uncharacterized protein n=1 Tax=Fictibacillus arsenicus TaxID=255247 RepID=A0A1V3GB23_9BACL|nr:hypothetical protein UN64_02300 [Fictibacillus arsenicus]
MEVFFLGAKNKVVAGDYESCKVSSMFGVVSISTGFASTLELSKKTVADYENIDETKRKSATSAVGRAFVGGLVLGPVGWLAGLSAKSKGTHMVAIEFKDGKKSLLEVDQKIYSALIKKMF